MLFTFLFDGVPRKWHWRWIVWMAFSEWASFEACHFIKSGPSSMCDMFPSKIKKKVKISGVKNVSSLAVDTNKIWPHQDLHLPSRRIKLWRQGKGKSFLILIIVEIAKGNTPVPFSRQTFTKVWFSKNPQIWSDLISSSRRHKNLHSPPCSGKKLKCQVDLEIWTSREEKAMFHHNLVQKFHFFNKKT